MLSSIWNCVIFCPQTLLLCEICILWNFYAPYDVIYISCLGLQLNLKFEIEVLCKHIAVEISDIKPSRLLDTAERAKLLNQLSSPKGPCATSARVCVCVCVWWGGLERTGVGEGVGRGASVCLNLLNLSSTLRHTMCLFCLFILGHVDHFPGCVRCLLGLAKMLPICEI